MTNSLLEQIHQLVEPALLAAGYECVEVEYKREQTGWVCRVYIDRAPACGPARGPAPPPEDSAQGGIGHQDCVRASRELSPLLDAHDLIPTAYQLEVTSPGLNRPLRKLEHFRSQVGRVARARLKHGVNGRKNFCGTIVAVSEVDRTVTLQVDGAAVALPLADLERANLEYSFK